METQFGCHLILVEDKKEGFVKPFGQVREQIHQQVIQTRQQAAYDEKVKELEAAYGVERRSEA